MTQRAKNLALGRALATLGRPLVYGGGRQGIMGIISSATLSHGGSVTAVVPSAMLRAGGEGDQTSGGHVNLSEEGYETVRSLRHAAGRLALRDSETS